MSFREGERDEALSILQELSSAFGVSGFEEDVRGAIVRRVEPIVGGHRGLEQKGGGR